MLNRSNIEEANKHLQALYTRVSELENVAEEQHNALMAKDSFIQTKIKELSQQDILIEDLKHKLEDRERTVTKTNEQISILQEELCAKNLQISTLKQKRKALSDIIDLLPELKSYISKIDTITAKVLELDHSDGYVEVNVSPSLSDDADNTDGGVMKTYTKPNEDVNENSSGQLGSVAEMARNFAHLEGIKKFSVTDDDTEEGEIKVSRNSGTLKELYF